MKNIKVYESFENEEEENIEILKSHLANPVFRKEFDRAFSERSIDADIVENPESETEFIVECWPKSFDGAVSNRISYQIDEIAKILGSELGVGEMSWRFGPGGGVSRIIFDMGQHINRDMVKVKNMIM
jgi:hypothetical protein